MVGAPLSIVSDGEKNLEDLAERHLRRIERHPNGLGVTRIALADELVLRILL